MWCRARSDRPGRRRERERGGRGRRVRRVSEVELLTRVWRGFIYLSSTILQPLSVHVVPLPLSPPGNYIFGRSAPRDLPVHRQHLSRSWCWIGQLREGGEVRAGGVLQDGCAREMDSRKVRGNNLFSSNVSGCGWEERVGNLPLNASELARSCGRSTVKANFIIVILPIRLLSHGRSI